MKIEILYPEMAYLFGDNANVLYLKKTLPDAEFVSTSKGDAPRFLSEKIDLVYLGALTERNQEKAIKLLKLGSVLQQTVYGVPSVFYGDEAGLEGYRDPFCRMPFPWGREDMTLTDHYKMLGSLRASHPCFKDGDFKFLTHNERCISYRRTKEEDSVTVRIDIENMEYEITI